MEGHRTKLRKSKRKNPTKLEDRIAQALFDLEVNNAGLGKTLSSLTFNTAKLVQIGPGKRAIVIFFPLRFIHKYRKIHKQLVSELEKRFSGNHIVLIAQRKIAPPPKSKHGKVPRTRTLTAVHDAILADICYPFDIVGRRWRYKVDGTRINKIFLHANEKDKAESRLETFALIYKRLTSKKVVFGFMTNPLLQQFL